MLPLTSELENSTRARNTAAEAYVILCAAEKGSAMSEREIRSLLRIICDELDVRAAKVGRAARKVVLPSMIGAGLALTGGCDDGRAVQTDGIIAGVDAAYGVDMSMDVGPGPLYMAPVDAAYLAPDASGDGVVPVPDLVYMGPDAGPPDAAKVDAGPQPPYTAPDAGPVPPYTAPMDGGE